MIKIDDYDRFWVHDLFKELGREVVREESNGNLGMRSRLCNKDALCLLLGKEGPRHVKALKLDSNYAHNFTSAELSCLSGLRFMELHGGSFVGECEDSYCLSKLLWFSWKNCPVECRWTNLCFQNLVVLRLSHSNVTDTWSGWGQFKTARNLKVLELVYLDINTTPDFSSFLSLEKLVIWYCDKLVHIDTSIANLESLNSLEMIHVRFIDFPIHLSNSICNLRALTRLVIVRFKLERLPDSIGELKCLKIMEISGSQSLKNLPDSIGDLGSLCVLVLSANKITELPESICKLRRLTILDVSRNELTGLPARIVDLDRLEVLDVTRNRALEWEIPQEIYNLQSLKSLNLEGMRICRQPSWIGQLSRLEWLSLGSHDEILEGTNLPVGLTRLEIKFESLKSIPDLSSLTNLVRLSLSDFTFWEATWNNRPATWIQHLDKLMGLTLTLSPMPCDFSTGLDQPSPTITDLMISCPNPSEVCLPSGLQSLTLCHSATLSRWEFLCKLRGLSKLVLKNVFPTEIRLDGLELLKNLTELSIFLCRFLERVDGISRLQNLRNFDIVYCSKLVEIADLSRPPDSLRELTIIKCDKIRYLPPLSDTQSPGRLNLWVFQCKMMPREYKGPYEGYFLEE